MNKTKLTLVGGFLGAGKTTLLSVAGKLLEKNHKVGLITNDQATGLVDTQLLTAHGFSVLEIAGSCFCCDFNGFMKAASYLRNIEKCDIILGEPVGSCTDLSSTLLQPIKAYYADDFVLSPLSVLVDPIRLLSVFDEQNECAEGGDYIYQKQLEEADLIVINKTDLLNNEQQQTLKKLLASKFPDHPVSWVSASQAEGITAWMDELENGAIAGSRIARVDYDIYAKGEAEMGWYNASFKVQSDEGVLIPWKTLNNNFLLLLREVFKFEKVTIGHIKTFLKSGASHLNGNLVSTESDVNLIGDAFESESARLVLNIRAEASSVLLKEIVDDIIDNFHENNIYFEILELKHLSPGRPIPTHRFEKIY